MSVWYSMKREVQGIADAAAVTAAHTLFQGGTETEATTAAEALAVRNGYDDTVAGNQITLTYNSVTTGAITETVQGTVRVAAPMYFAGLFLDEIHVAAGAAAGLQQLGQQCVLALHTSAPGTITFEGNTDADVGCGVASNSSHVSQSIIVSGSAVLTANPVAAGVEVRATAVPGIRVESVDDLEGDRHDGHAGGASDPMKTGSPSIHVAAGALGRQRKKELLLRMKELHHLIHHPASRVRSIHRNAAERPHDGLGELVRLLRSQRAGREGEPTEQHEHQSERDMHAMAREVLRLVGAAGPAAGAHHLLNAGLNR